MDEEKKSDLRHIVSMLSRVHDALHAHHLSKAPLAPCRVTSAAVDALEKLGRYTEAIVEDDQAVKEELALYQQAFSAIDELEEEVGGDGCYVAITEPEYVGEFKVTGLVPVDPPELVIEEEVEEEVVQIQSGTLGSLTHGERDEYSAALKELERIGWPCRLRELPGLYEKLIREESK